MNIKNHNPREMYPQYIGQAHAVEVASGARTLHISGLNGYELDGKTLPESFEDQSELIWKHLKVILASAGMGVPNLVFLRTYLAKPEYRDENRRIRKKHLGDHECHFESLVVKHASHRTNENGALPRRLM